MQKTKEKKQNKLIVLIKTFTLKYPTLAEIIRFLLVGGLATLIDMFIMGVFLYLVQPEIYPSFFNVFYGGGDPSNWSTVVGTGLGFLCGLIFNYFLSVLFVYVEKGNAKSFKGFTVFALLSLVGLLIHVVGMWLGYDILHINEWIVKIVLIVVVLVYNYISKKMILFSKKENGENK